MKNRINNLFGKVSESPEITQQLTQQPWIKTSSVMVNLRNVSNINILDSRIVFNMNYTIDISNSQNPKFISDYVYWDSKTEQDIITKLEALQRNEYIQENFIFVDDCYINTNEISSIKFLDSQSRIIFNLSHPVSFKGKHSHNLTSEFVYINCSDNYSAVCEEIKSKLNLGE